MERVLKISDGITRVKKGDLEKPEQDTVIMLSSSVALLDDSAFEGWERLCGVIFADTPLRIRGCAFRDCVSLVCVDLPQGLVGLGSSVFSGCVKLKSATLPKQIPKIGSSLFENCISLETFFIPEGVREIHKNAFFGCEALRSVVFPDGLLRIGLDAFRGCRSLCELVIPPSVVRIEEGAFQGCQSLRSVTLDRIFEDQIEKIFGDSDREIFRYR